jgi:hypothetical protein
MGFGWTKQGERVMSPLFRVMTVFLAVCIFTKVWASLATLRAAKIMAEAAKAYRETESSRSAESRQFVC